MTERPTLEIAAVTVRVDRARLGAMTDAQLRAAIERGLPANARDERVVASLARTVRREVRR